MTEQATRVNNRDNLVEHQTDFGWDYYLDDSLYSSVSFPRRASQFEQGYRDCEQGVKVKGCMDLSYYEGYGKRYEEDQIKNSRTIHQEGDLL